MLGRQFLTAINEINHLVQTVDQEVGGSSPPSCTNDLAVRNNRQKSLGVTAGVTGRQKSGAGFRNGRRAAREAPVFLSGYFR